MSRQDDTTVHLNADYVESSAFTVKLYCLGLVLVSYLLVSLDPHGVAYFFQSVTLIVFICTKDFLLLNLFNVPSPFTDFPWQKYEEYFCYVSCFFLGLASLLIIFSGSIFMILIGLIGLGATGMYGYDGNLKYNQPGFDQTTETL